MVVHAHWLILFQRLIHRFSIDEAVRRYQGGVFSNASVTVYENQDVGGKSRLTLVDENINPWQEKI
jgi:hypothetical protein